MSEAPTHPRIHLSFFSLHTSNFLSLTVLSIMLQLLRLLIIAARVSAVGSGLCIDEPSVQWLLSLLDDSGSETPASNMLSTCLSRHGVHGLRPCRITGLQFSMSGSGVR